MMTITLGNDSLKVSYPVTHQPEDKDWLHHVTVQKSIGFGMVFTVGSNRPGSYTVSNGIDSAAAKILAHWILDNVE